MDENRIWHNYKYWNPNHNIIHMLSTKNETNHYAPATFNVPNDGIYLVLVAGWSGSTITTNGGEQIKRYESANGIISVIKCTSGNTITTNSNQSQGACISSFYYLQGYSSIGDLQVISTRNVSTPVSYSDNVANFICGCGSGDGNNIVTVSTEYEIGHIEQATTRTYSFAVAPTIDRCTVSYQLGGVNTNITAYGFLE